MIYPLQLNDDVLKALQSSLVQRFNNTGIAQKDHASTKGNLVTAIIRRFDIEYVTTNWFGHVANILSTRHLTIDSEMVNELGDH